MRNYGKYQTLVEDVAARALEYYGVKKFEKDFLTDAVYYHIFLYGLESFDGVDIIKVIKFLHADDRYKEWKEFDKRLSRGEIITIDENDFSKDSFQYQIYSKFDTIMMVVMGLGHLDVIEDIFIKRGCHNYNQFLARLMTFRNVNEREPIKVLNEILSKIGE